MTLVGKRVAICGCLLTVVEDQGRECKCVCRHGSVYYVGKWVIAAAAPVFSRAQVIERRG